MDIRGWFIAFHVIGLIFYIGGMVFLARLLMTHVREANEDGRKRLIELERQILNSAVRPGALLVIGFGLLLFLGVGTQDSAVGMIKFYMKPLTGENNDIPTTFYATFHAKFVLLAVLLGLHGYLESRASKFAAGGLPKSDAGIMRVQWAVIAVAVVMIALMKTDILKGSGSIAQAKQAAKMNKADSGQSNKPADEADPVSAMRAAIAALQAKPEKTAATIEVQHLLVGVSNPRMPQVKRTPAEAEQRAAELLERVRNGESFDALVKQFTDDSHPGIYGMTMSGPGDTSRNMFPRAGMAPAFGNVGWKLEVGEVGVAPHHPTDSPFGYHIIKRTK